MAGNGIAIAGGQDIVLRHNTVADNQGSTFLSGGIVVASTAGLGGSDAATNTVVANTVEDNQPADLVYDGKGTGNHFRHNACTTSLPPGLCQTDGDE